MGEFLHIEMNFIKNVRLTEMCLSVIVNNLELIVINRSISQKSVDFLIRLYGKKVFHDYRKMKRKNHETVEEDVMLWFLNPHAKEVTLHSDLFSQRIINKFQVIGMGITSLNLHRLSAPENVLNAIIRCVPAVKILDLSHTCCTDNTLSIIQETCTEIENLNLSHCKNLTEIGHFEVLKRMPLLECYKISCFASFPFHPGNFLNEIHHYREIKCNLKELIYYSKYETTEVIQALIKMCPKIKRLQFESPVRENVIQACTEFQELEVLKFKSYHTCTDIIQRVAEKCPKMKKLHFESPDGTSILQACVGFQELEELKFKELHHYGPHDFLRVNLSSPILPISFNLKTLILSDLQIPAVTLVENFKNLKKLCLKKVSFTPFKENDIKCAENKLDILVIKDANMEISSPSYKAIILLISLSKNVSKLDLSHNRELPSDLFVAILNSMKNLCSVNFYCTPIKTCFLIPFFDIPSLNKIYANGSCYDASENDAIQIEKLSKLLSTSFWKPMSYKDYHHNNPHDDDFDSDDSSDTTDDDSENDNLTYSDYDDVYIPRDDETYEEFLVNSLNYMFSRLYSSQ